MHHHCQCLCGIRGQSNGRSLDIGPRRSLPPYRSSVDIRTQEGLEFSLQQMQLASTARDFNDLAARQIELSTQFAERATQRSQDLIKASTEHQAELSKWFDQAVSESAKGAKKAA